MSSYTKFMPAKLAAALRCVQTGIYGGALAGQNARAIIAAAKTEAAGSAIWAKFDPVSGALLIKPSAMSTFVTPIHS